MEGYAIARQNGWMSANDIRALENLNPIPDEEGGSTYLVNGNMVPVNLCGVTQLIAAAAAAEAAQNAPDQQEDSSQDSSPQQNQKKSPISRCTASRPMLPAESPSWCWKPFRPRKSDEEEISI